MKKPIKLLVREFEYHVFLKPQDYKLVRSKKVKTYYHVDLEINSTASRVKAHGPQELTGHEDLHLTLSSVEIPTNTPFTSLVFCGIFSSEKA